MIYACVKVKTLIYFILANFYIKEQFVKLFFHNCYSESDESSTKLRMFLFIFPCANWLVVNDEVSPFTFGLFDVLTKSLLILE